MTGPSNTPSAPPSEHESIDLRTLFIKGIDLRTADEDLIQKYAMYVFQGYKEDNLEDFRLWESLHFDFENFRKEHFDKLDQRTWSLVRDYCYTRGIWLDHDFGTSCTRTSAMLTAIKREWYEEWTSEQIEYVEKRYHTLSRCVLKRKHDLVASLEPPNHPVTSQPLGQQTVANPQIEPEIHTPYRPPNHRSYLSQYGPLNFEGDSSINAASQPDRDKRWQRE